MSSNDNLRKEDSEEQHSVHLLRYEYIEGLRCMTKLLLLSALTLCTLLYYIESMLCYLLVPAMALVLQSHIYPDIFEHTGWTANAYVMKVKP